MKYWVYKESHILGPFDKEAVSGLPGLDSGTLVCSGDPSGAAWRPAGEVEGLTGLLPGGASGFFDEPPSSVGLLDQLQIDAAGMIGEHEFLGTFAEELFQDASYKSSFDQLKGARDSDEAEVRRSRDKITELTSQLEAMHRKISELELGQADLKHKLAAKEQELRARIDASVVPAEDSSVIKTFLSPAPPPIQGGPPPVAAVPLASLAPSEWPDVPAPKASLFEAIAPAPVVPSAPASALPPMPSFSAPAAAPVVPIEPAAPPAVPPPAAAPSAPAGFGKAKSFKVGWATRSFKVLGPGEPAPAPSNAPTPVFSNEAPEPAPVVAALPPAPEAATLVVPIVASVPAPVVVAPAPVPAEIPVVLAPALVPPPPSAVPAEVVSAVAPAQEPVPAEPPITNPFATTPPPPMPTPYVPPPNTLSRSQPVPDFTFGGAPLSTPEIPAGEAASARFAKPEPAPATGEVKKARGNKAFVIAGGLLVTLLAAAGWIFMRQPKDDLKQMATLDDGAAPLGLPADEFAAPPIVKPKVAEPVPDPAAAERAAAIALVKDFPLDGGRVSVGHWLQYSYTANPNAGTEEWNASSTGENTMLVQYRLVPGAAGGKSALYLFEADANGIVMGKNIEAREMLAGSPPPDEPKAVKSKKAPVKKAAPKRAIKRRAVREAPKEVPLLPLPDSGELRPPAEDDGSFGTDTIESGI